MRGRKIRSVPVLMFHGVAPDHPDRPPSMAHWLGPELFERYLVFLKRQDFRTLFLDELSSFRRSETDLPARSIALTFDDGYVDFWLYVFPLLAKYQLKATVFIATDFVAGDGPPRRLPEAWPYGFLSWAELREMEASGLVDAQSHTRTHTWYFTGPRLVDVHRPELSWGVLRFLWWNRFPERKPLWHHEGRHQDLPWGLPVLEHEKSLLARRYFLSPEVESLLVRRVGDCGGAAFFDRPGWFETYRRWYEEGLRTRGDGAGHFETESERRERITHELQGSRLLLGERLNKEVRFLCCPGGSLSEEVIDLATRCGYLALTVPPRFECGLNRPGGDPRRLYRDTSTSIFHRFRSDFLDTLSFRCRVGSELGISTYRGAWTLLRGLRSLQLI